MGYHFDIEVPVNGHVGPATVNVLDDGDGRILVTDRANLDSLKELGSLGRHKGEPLSAVPGSYFAWL
jgi:hypothetical protein